MVNEVPWAGIVALVLMFVLPALPGLFEGPRTIRHRPTRHVCRDCGAPWVDGHTCALDADVDLDPDPGLDLDREPLRAELRRLDSRVELPRRPRRRALLR